MVKCAADGKTAIDVQDQNKVSTNMFVVWSSEERDLALLGSIETAFHISQSRIGRIPHPGIDVCVVAGSPRRTRKCGQVQYYRNKPPGDIWHGAETFPGNSGSGLYDDKGRLVGVVTHAQMCSGFYGRQQICGGFASSLWTVRAHL